MLVEIETDAEGNVVLVYGIVAKQRTQVILGVQRNFFVTDVGAGSVDEIIDVEITFGFLPYLIAVFIFELKDLL